MIVPTGPPDVTPAVAEALLRLLVSSEYDSGHEEIERHHDEWQQRQHGQTT